MALHFTFDSSEPEWWLENEAVPKDGWTVKGELFLQGPDGHWVGVHFREGCPTADLIGVVRGGGSDA